MFIKLTENARSVSRSSPDDFETSMASAFDESYQESLNALRTLQSNYDTKMKALVALYQGNLDDAIPRQRNWPFTEQNWQSFNPAFSKTIS